MTSQSIPEATKERLIRLPEVEATTGLNRNAIYTMPGFPKPVKIGARATAWVQSEIQLWIKSTIERQR